jgi:TolB protein
MKQSLRTIALLLACLLLPAAALAQGLSIDIYGPGQSKLNIVLTKPLGADPAQSPPADASALQGYVQTDLNFLPFLTMVPAASILGGDSPGGIKAEQIDFGRYKKSQVDIIVTTGWTPSDSGLGNVELRAFNVSNPQQPLIVGKAYMHVTRDQLPVIANRFCAALMEALTGKPGFFDSTIAFVKRSGQNKEIWVVAPTGQGLRQITTLRGISMSPTISPDGGHIAFTHVGPTEHTLGVWNAASGTTRTIKLPGTSVISPCYMPGGGLAVALDLGGNTDIVSLTPDFKIASKLVATWAIEVSPAFDESGKMVYVSNRLGNPHVFLGGGEGRRISMEGKYNTNPTISPDGKFVAYSRELPDGHRIFLQDLSSGSEKQLTFGPGSDEHPWFSPDGYFIVFTSSRAGGYKLYITSRNGDTPIQVPTGDGDATSPTWGKTVGGSAM